MVAFVEARSVEGQRQIAVTRRVGRLHAHDRCEQGAVHLDGETSRVCVEHAGEVPLVGIARTERRGRHRSFEQPLDRHATTGGHRLGDGWFVEARRYPAAPDQQQPPVVEFEGRQHVESGLSPVFPIALQDLQIGAPRAVGDHVTELDVVECVAVEVRPCRGQGLQRGEVDRGLVHPCLEPGVDLPDLREARELPLAQRDARDHDGQDETVSEECARAQQIRHRGEATVGRTRADPLGATVSTPPRTRSLHADVHRHLGWDRSVPPAAHVAPGDEVELTIRDCFDGQLTPDATSGDVVALDLSRANPLTGPVHVEGATPGDTLVVEVLEVEPDVVGWTTAIPGFGLLADELPEPHVVVSRVGAHVEFGDVAVLDRAPFLGTVGVAPAEPGVHSVIPPRLVGGNLDCRDVAPGATLLLPVEVDGALLSVGDPHAAQGDGEVCGTAVEVPARARLRVSVERGTGLDAPLLQAAPRSFGGRGHPDGGRVVTFGIGPDLHTASRDATRRMIEWLGRRDVDTLDAYLLCSVAGDLRIVEVVNEPHWVVALDLDPAVLA